MFFLIRAFFSMIRFLYNGLHVRGLDMIHMRQTIMKNNPILIVKLLKLSMLQFSKEITF
jgi:hypothetical protein